MNRPAPRRRPRSTAVPPDRPFVLVNMAVSADGKIATANRSVENLGSARDATHLYELRATVDAVLCGARTASADGVTLGMGGEIHERRRRRLRVAPQLLRVIVSGRGRLPLDAGPFLHPGGPIIVLTTTRVSARRRTELAARSDAVVALGEREVDLVQALAWLRRERGARRLVCEGGGELNDAMFRAGLVDEVHVTLCPKILGGRNAPTLAEGMGWARLSEATRLRLRQVRRVADELFLIYRVIR